MKREKKQLKIQEQRQGSGHMQRLSTYIYQSQLGLKNLHFGNKKCLNYYTLLNLVHVLACGSGFGSVGRVVASESRGPSSNPVIGKNYTLNCIEKTKINKKRPASAHFLN